MPLTHLSLEFDAQGPTYNCLTACAASTQAIGEATEILRRGDADVMIAGGSEAAITPLSYGGFCSMKAMSTNNDDFEHASRPFDSGRDGFVMGEGAGVIVLETLEHAKKRGASIRCELVGYGASCDANHITAPHPEGKGLIGAMTEWTAASGVTARDMLIHERRTRLFMTGRRLADMYRFGIQSDTWDPGSVAMTRPGTLYPIPSSEVDANCLLNGSC